MPTSHKSEKMIMSFKLLTAAILLVILFLADYIVGTFYETSMTREVTGRFRSEVAPLRTTTKHLVPNLDHEYRIENKTKSRVRIVQTDDFGLLKGSSNKDSSSAKKILFLGGSTTENNEVDEAYRFPYLVGERLNKFTHQKFSGLNAGIRAHTTQDSLNLYLNHPSPDIANAEVVVIMHNINDRLRLTLSDSFKSDLNYHSPLTLNGVIDNFNRLIFSIWDWIKFRSNIIFLIDVNWYELSQKDKNKGVVITEGILDEVATLKDKQVDLFNQNIKLLVAVIRTRERTPILMTQPLGKKSQGQELFNEAIRKVAETEKIYLIDLENHLNSTKDPQKLFLSDEIHFNNNGSKWAANIISKEINKILTKEIASSKQELGCSPLKIAGKSFLNEPLSKNIFPGRYPSIDLSGTRLLFQKNNSSGSSISILNLKSGLIDTLLRNDDPNWYEHPTWYDKNHIIYGIRNNSRNYLYILDIRNKNSKALFNNENLWGAIADVSPHKRIVFAGYSQIDGHLTSPEIYFMEGLNSPPKQLTENQSENWRPFFNATQNSVYYINNESGNFQVYSLEFSSPQSPNKITKSKLEHWDPAISIDGSFLSYAVKNGGNFDIWIEKISTNQHYKKRLIHSSENEWDPRFSPDSQYLLYAGTSPHGDQIRAFCLNNYLN
jgi:Tol biopolymer transport system component